MGLVRPASRRRPQARLARALRRADDLGQAPVDHQRLAVLADHDIARLDVAVEHAPAVGISDRVADIQEPSQQLLDLQRPLARAAPGRFGAVESLDRLAEAIPLMNRIA